MTRASKPDVASHSPSTNSSRSTPAHSAVTDNPPPVQTKTRTSNRQPSIDDYEDPIVASFKKAERKVGRARRIDLPGKHAQASRNKPAGPAGGAKHEPKPAGNSGGDPFARMRDHLSPAARGQ